MSKENYAEAVPVDDPEITKKDISCRQGVGMKERLLITSSETKYLFSATPFNYKSLFLERNSDHCNRCTESLSCA
jgi:hypothetical protein